MVDDKEEAVSEPNNWIRIGLLSIPKALEFLGPVLAGFQAAAAFMGYIGVGEFAKWAIQYWFPFTRWI